MLLKVSNASLVFLSKIFRKNLFKNLLEDAIEASQFWRKKHSYKYILALVVYV
jgi:hypothetical protein